MSVGISRASRLFLPIVISGSTLALGYKMGAESQDWPDGVIARVDGQAVNRQDYSQWLLQTHGWAYVKDFCTLFALRQKAQELGIDVTPEDLESAFKTKVNDRVTTQYRSDIQRYLKALKEDGLDLDGVKRRESATMERDLLATEVLRKTVPPTDDSLKVFHQELFGEAGEHIQLKVAFFDRFKGIEEGDTRSPEKMQEMTEGARQRAQAFAKAVAQSPSSFATLSEQQSDPTLIRKRSGFMRDIRRQGGEISHYVPAHFRGALEESLAEAKPGELVGPLETPQGFYVYTLTKRETAPLDSVRDELIELFHQRLPTPPELFGLIEKVRGETKIEFAPDFP